MPERSIEPNPTQLQAFLEGAQVGKPIAMINLLRYREAAAYPDDGSQLPEGFDASPCSGRDAYARYGQVALPLIGAHGGRVLWAGSVAASLIAPGEEEWDDAVLVEYPSPAAFVQMVTSEAYLAGAPHRSAALLDSRLIATNGQLDPLGAQG